MGGRTGAGVRNESGAATKRVSVCHLHFACPPEIRSTPGDVAALDKGALGHILCPHWLVHSRAPCPVRISWEQWRISICLHPFLLKYPQEPQAAIE